MEFDRQLGGQVAGRKTVKRGQSQNEKMKWKKNEIKNVEKLCIDWEHSFWKIKMQQYPLKDPFTTNKAGCSFLSSYTCVLLVPWFISTYAYFLSPSKEFFLSASFIILFCFWSLLLYSILPCSAFLRASHCLQAHGKIVLNNSLSTLISPVSF